MVCAFPTSMLVDKRVWHFISELTRGPSIPTDDAAAPLWFEPGIICEISMETYFDFLELFRSRWRHGSVFVSSDTSGSERLFWRQGDRFFGRELTADELQAFTELTDTHVCVQATPSDVGADAPAQIRLACVHCDTDEFDGVDAISDDRVFVTRYQSSEESLEEMAADDPTASPSERYSHAGICPECQTTPDDAVEQERLRQAYLEQQRRLSCPGCGEEPFLG